MGSVASSTRSFCLAGETNILEIPEYYRTVVTPVEFRTTLNWREESQQRAEWESASAIPLEG